MINMFRDVIVFNQDFSSWNIFSVSVVDNFGLFLVGLGLFIENYDVLFIGWSQLDLLFDMYLGVGLISYFCVVVEVCQSMIDIYGWMIDDGGFVVDCDFVLFVIIW